MKNNAYLMGKTMEDNVRKELDAILGMVNNWKLFYLKHVTGENDEYLLSDFLEELNTTHVYPFIYKMFQAKHVTLEEKNEFMLDCYEHVVELGDAIENARLK